MTGMGNEIKIPANNAWNAKRMTIVEVPGSLGDRLLICIHDEDECAPDAGATVMVYRADFVRLARMISIPYEAAQ